MPKHVFFDLDDTLTPSRSRMKSEHEQLFAQLSSRRDIVVVSGAQESQMRKQLPDPSQVRYYMLTQNGNHAISPDSQVLWSESFSNAQKQVIVATIERWRAEVAIDVHDEEDLVEDRGSQISYSLIGHEEDRAKKAAFDPGGPMRTKFLKAHPEDAARLVEAGIEVTVAGTTCFDFFLLGKNKGFHVARVAQRMNWNKNDCLYIGDALEPGRNDETVIGVVPTHQVKNPDDTFRFIGENLLS